MNAAFEPDKCLVTEKASLNVFAAFQKKSCKYSTFSMKDLCSVRQERVKAPVKFGGHNIS